MEPDTNDPAPPSVASTPSPTPTPRPSPSPPQSEAQVEATLNRAAELAAENARTRAAEALLAPLDETPARPEERHPVGAVETSEQAAARRRARGDAIRRKLIDAAGVPSRYARADLDDLSSLPLDVRSAYAEAVAILRATVRQPVIVALSGPRGPGKTHIACGVVLEACGRLDSARYAVSADFFREIRSQFAKARGTAGDEASVVASYASPSLLVLDEVQERGESDWEQRTLTGLLDRRYAEELATVLITNQTKGDFLRGVGESVASRIRDDGGVIECLWPSLRGRFTTR